MKKTLESGKISCSWIGQIKAVTMAILQKRIYTFIAKPIKKIPVQFLA